MTSIPAENIHNIDNQPINDGILGKCFDYENSNQSKTVQFIDFDGGSAMDNILILKTYSSYGFFYRAILATVYSCRQLSATDDVMISE